MSRFLKTNLVLPRGIARVLIVAGMATVLLSTHSPVHGVVKTYHHGVDGYTGVKDTFIRHSYTNAAAPEDLADINFGHNASISSSRTNALDYELLPSGEMAGLVRFENLNHSGRIDHQ